MTNEIQPTPDAMVVKNTVCWCARLHAAGAPTNAKCDMCMAREIITLRARAEAAEQALAQVREKLMKMAARMRIDDGPMNGCSGYNGEMFCKAEQWADDLAALASPAMPDAR